MIKFSDIFRLWLAIVIAMAMVSCVRKTAEKDCIYIGNGIEVYGDSIVRGDTVYRPELTVSVPDTDGFTLPAYSSAQSVADAIFAQSVSAATDALTPLDIYLSAGLLNPQESMERLRQAAAAWGSENADFPLSANVAYWGAAAWEVYCTTGSKTWLREARDTLQRMLDAQKELNSSPLSDLYCGQPRNISDPATRFPKWMDEMDRFQSFSSVVNIARVQSLETAALMAAQAGVDDEADALRAEADRLKGTINDRLWLPDRQHYGQYLYGRYYPIVSPLADYEANALAILTGTATSEMAAAIIGTLPIVGNDVPEIYPSVGTVRRAGAGTTGLYALAAALVRNSQIFTFASGSALAEAIASPTPAVWPAIVIKGIFGLRFKPDGVLFTPMVPEKFSGDKSLTGLRYREAILDIELRGGGDRIASFQLDSVSMPRPMIGNDLKGHHKITITLSGNELDSKSPAMAEEVLVPQIPMVKWTSGFEFTVSDPEKDTRYDIYVNGEMLREINGSEGKLTQSNSLQVTSIVPVGIQDATGFSPAPHVEIPSNGLVNIPASSITPRRPPRHFIKDPATASNYIELAARHNTRITCYANIAEAGDYFITIGYSNGSERCGIRSLDINDRPAGSLLFPARRPGDWVSVYPSTTSVVTLTEGVNKISLTYVRGTILFNRLTLIKRP